MISMTTTLQKRMSVSILKKGIFQNLCPSEALRVSWEAIQFLITSNEICLFEGQNPEFEMHFIERRLLSSGFEKPAQEGDLIDR
jgi:hypothetical protein